MRNRGVLRETEQATGRHQEIDLSRLSRLATLATIVLRCMKEVSGKQADTLSGRR